MSHPGVVILYVANPTASTAFYAQLLDREPVESSPNFAMFALDSGIMLGLWSMHAVEPKATMTGGGGELAFSLGNDAEVDAWHERCREQRMMIELSPKRMDFGYTFVAADPDGHRLRVFAPSES
ncbi:VOC family protein [Burkholderia sp. Ac-20353]|uniref:VOC family protein n=1 Tax=Burkholderia sp. Ac-20353 TaxID=2703894 RepID=UPI00197C1D21|nr:VOC family protein [Burkholderia sp. Ac-20353]MBN3791556.1 drug:proton antiporter [Burkholderia sp. Ac-20353]